MRRAAFAALMLLATAGAYSSAAAAAGPLRARVSGVNARVDNLRRYGPECEDFQNLFCEAGKTCRVVDHHRCTPGGINVAFTVSVVAHPGRVHVELWDVHPGCATPGRPCSKALRMGFDWTVPAAQVGVGASKDFEIAGAHADLPEDTIEVLVGGADLATDRAAAPAECENVGPTPLGRTIALRLQAIHEGAVAAEIESWLAFAIAQGDGELESTFRRGLVLARCRSGGKMGPANPYDVPAADVQRWLVDLVGDDAPLEAQVLRPIVTSLSAGALRCVWLRAVELRRGLPFRAGACGSAP
jgi:hypothetical protein